MMDHTIITIGRQFGSGGHEVGNRLAERLNIPLYDHNLIRMAARRDLEMCYQAIILEWVIILHLCSVRKWRNH
mgnify:CR=1 FL=1